MPTAAKRRGPIRKGVAVGGRSKPAKAAEIHNRLSDWFFGSRAASSRTRAQVAADLQVPTDTVKGWTKRGRAIPDPKHLIRIAEVEGMNLNWLLLGEGRPERLVTDPAGDLDAALREYLTPRLAEYFQVDLADIEAYFRSAGTRPKELVFRAVRGRVRKHLDQILTGRLADALRQTRTKLPKTEKASALFKVFGTKAEARLREIADDVTNEIERDERRSRRHHR